MACSVIFSECSVTCGRFSGQGQRLVFLLQLLARLPKIAIVEAQQKVLGSSNCFLHEALNISVANWITVLYEDFQEPRSNFSSLWLLSLLSLIPDGFLRLLTIPQPIKLTPII